MTINKNFSITLAGLIWGFSGFTVEFISQDAASLQLYFRLFLVLISASIIIASLKIKINRKYHLGLSLFTMYFIAYLTTSMMHGILVTDLLREFLLIFAILVIYILLSSKIYIFDFIKGVFVALCILIIYYFFSIDFSKILSSYYRLFTGLNPNGIGVISVMTFTISYFLVFSKEYIDKKYLYLGLAIMAFIIVLATRSRTSIIMLVLSFIVINIYFKNRRILLGSLVGIALVIIWKLDVLEAVLRLKAVEDYSGQNNIYNLTGRTELWAHGLELIKGNLLFGVGPKDAYAIVDGHKGTFHNAIIQLFVTVGLFGLIPVLTMILLAFRAVFFSKILFLVKAIFIVGVIGSMAESQLFNFGSPGNLLFLISLLYLIGINIKAKT